MYAQADDSIITITVIIALATASTIYAQAHALYGTVLGTANSYNAIDLPNTLLHRYYLSIFPIDYYILL